MKKLTLAFLAVATLGMAAVPALAQDNAIIMENTQETIQTGNRNTSRSTSIQQHQDSNTNGGNTGAVIRNRQVCDSQGNDNTCEKSNVQQTQTIRRNNRN